MIFRVDFDKWVLTLLPSFLRCGVMFALCRAAIAPIRTLYGQFGEARKSHLFALTHNGQVCYLRAALNEAFGTTGFDIIDYDDGRGDWLFAKSEDLQEQLYAVDERLCYSDTAEGNPTRPVPILYDETRLNLAQNSFIVQVPSDIYATQLDKVRGIVEQYRPLSKKPIYTPIN